MGTLIYFIFSIFAKDYHFGGATTKTVICGSLLPKANGGGDRGVRVHSQSDADHQLQPLTEAEQFETGQGFQWSRIRKDAHQAQPWLQSNRPYSRGNQGLPGIRLHQPATMRWWCPLLAVPPNHRFHPVQGDRVTRWHEFFNFSPRTRAGRNFRLDFSCLPARE